MTAEAHVRSTVPPPDVATAEEARQSFWIYTIPDHAANEAARAELLRRLDVVNVAADGSLDALVAETCAALGTRMAAITLIQGYDAHLIATAGFPPGVYRRSTSLCGHAVLASDRTFVVPDTLTDARFAGNPYVAGEDGIRFYAAAQLVAGAELVIGTLCVFDTAPRPTLSGAEKLALLSLADAVMVRLQGIGAARRDRAAT